ncbi:DUF3854 domain-containing protein [Laspinema sp. D1]|uniref:DUF3854 domain-containing protein n=1 Tax=Laspinema palackyanum D2a TaxID=2953684 RepID=A0ABT2N034_9CYAN|nr:DUF3854 domain-containing protein [Laspinema sp. D2a]
MFLSNEFQEWFKNDLYGSGISREIIKLNFKPFGETVEGEEGALIDYLLYSPKLHRRQSSGCPVDASYIKRYSNLNEGGWVHQPLDPLSGWESTSLWCCIKPIAPRSVDSKLIKYEHPPKEPTGIFYLNPGPEAWDKISQRYGVPKGEYTNFWQWVKAHPNLPIYITEGAKKSASLLSAGYIAIALPGVWNFADKDPLTKVKSLKPALTAIGLAGRLFMIAFDYDAKPASQEQVGAAANSLRILLKGAGAKVSFLRIPSLGKSKMGIDDYLVQTQDYELTGCNIRKSCPYPDKTLWSISDKYEQIRINQRYLGQFKNHLGCDLGDASGLLIVKTLPGVGKSWAVEQEVMYWSEFRDVLVITNRKSTGRALAKRFNLRYIDDKHETKGGKGTVFCVESCKSHGKVSLKVSGNDTWGEIKKGDYVTERGVVVILDEFDQTLEQMLGSDTCKEDRVEVINTFKGLMQDVLGRSNGLVVAMSADISDLDINFITDCVKPVKSIVPKVIVNEWKPEHKYDLHLYPSQVEVYQQAKRLIETNLELVAIGRPHKTLWFSTEGQDDDSTYGTTVLTKKLKEDIEGVKILTIDSDTLAAQILDDNGEGLIEKLNSIAPEYDVVLSSTSISSAVSMDGNYWSGVCDISAGLVHTREYRQRLDRVRAPVDRHCFIPERGMTFKANGSTYWKSIAATESAVFKESVRVLERADADDLSNQTCPIAKATFCKQLARFNYDYYDYRENAIDLLEGEGVKVINAGYLELSERKALAKMHKNFRINHHSSSCDARRDSPKWDDETAQAYEAGRFTEFLKEKGVEKGLITSTENISEQRNRQLELLSYKRYKVCRDLGGYEPLSSSLIAGHDDGTHKQWKLQMFYWMPDLAAKQDNYNLDFRKSSKAVHTPDFKSYLLKVKLLQELGIDALLTGDEFTKDSPEIKAVVKAIKAKVKRIKAVLGVTVNVNQSPIRICNDVLSLISSSLVESKRVRVDGKIKRFYHYPDIHHPAKGDIIGLWVDQINAKVKPDSMTTNVATESEGCDSTLIIQNPEKSEAPEPAPDKALDPVSNCDTDSALSITPNYFNCHTTTSSKNHTSPAPIKEGGHHPALGALGFRGLSYVPPVRNGMPLSHEERVLWWEFLLGVKASKKPSIRSRYGSDPNFYQPWELEQQIESWSEGSEYRYVRNHLGLKGSHPMFV